jgi:heat shock protein HslJ
MFRTRDGFGGTLVALALFATVVGCSSGSSGSAPASSTSAGGSTADLEGRNWVLTDASKLVAGASDVVVTARFEGGSMSGNSGCNSYTTTYKVNGSSLTLGANVAGTKMACPPMPTAVERAYLAALPHVVAFAVRGSTLTLTNTAGQALLTYRESSGAKALAGNWEVTGYYTGTAVQSPEAGSKLTAAFTSTQVSGDAGCNTFNGPFEVTGSSITIGPLGSTLKACASETVNTQEQQYLAALEAARTYAVVGDRLDLLRADGGFAVTFVKSGTAS